MTKQGRIRVGGVGVALVLLAAACGTDSDEATDTADQDSTTSSIDNATESSTTTAAAVTGDSGSEWCDRLDAIQEDGGPSPMSFNFLTSSPAEIEAQMKTNLETFEDWAEVAPPEIDGDIDTFVAAFGELVQAGDDAEWDINVLGSDPAFASALDDPEVAGAAERIDSYSRDVCGVDFGPGAAQPSASAPASGDIVGQIFPLPPGFVPADVLACMNDELAPLYPDPLPADFTPTAADVTNLEAAADSCGFDFLG